MNAYPPWEYTYLLPLAMLPVSWAWSCYVLMNVVAVAYLWYFARKTFSRNSKSRIGSACFSFLGEYPATGKPLIRLESSDRKIEPMKPARELFSTLYTARSMSDLVRLFDTIVLKGEDPAHDERIKAAKSAGLTGNDAAGNILDYLELLLEMKMNGTQNENGEYK